MSRQHIRRQWWVEILVLLIQWRHRPFTMRFFSALYWEFFLKQVYSLLGGDQRQWYTAGRSGPWMDLFHNPIKSFIAFSGMGFLQAETPEVAVKEIHVDNTQHYVCVWFKMMIWEKSFVTSQQDIAHINQPANVVWYSLIVVHSSTYSQFLPENYCLINSCRMFMVQMIHLRKLKCLLLLKRIESLSIV